MLENPPPKWLIYMTSKSVLDVGRRPQFLSTWASLQDYYSGNCFHLEGKSCAPLITQLQKSLFNSPIFSWLPRPVPSHCSGDSRRVGIPGERNTGALLEAGYHTKPQQAQNKSSTYITNKGSVCRTYQNPCKSKFF